MGVNVLVGSQVTDIQNETVFFAGESAEGKIESKTIIWGAGVMASVMGKVLADSTGVELDRVGRVIVNKDFSIPKYDDIFVIGDLARLKNDGKYLPGIATVAMQSGRFVANLIKNRAQGKDHKKEFRYKDKGLLAVIGRNKAVADLGFFTSKGFVAWLLWIFIHISYLIGFDNKISVLIKWGMNYFNEDKGTRLITK
jgi:NADH dehydrogenase